MSAFGPEIDSAALGDPGTRAEGREAGSGDPGRQESPAGRLRRAVETLERAAANATPGPWHPEHGYNDRTRVQAVFVDCPATDGCDSRDCIDGTHGIGGFDRDPDNRWSLLADPAIAPPLAALLRETADSVAMHVAAWQRPPTVTFDGDDAPQRTAGQVAALVDHHFGHALAVADVILGA